MLNNPRARTLLRICSFFALVTAVFYTSTFIYAYIYDAINTPVVADELYDACFELPTIEPTGSWSLSGEKEGNAISTTKTMHDLCGGGCLHSTWDPFSLDFEMNCSHEGTYVYEGDMAIRDGLQAHEKRYQHKVTHHNRSDFIYSYCPSSPCKSKHNLIVRNKYYNKIWQRAKKDEKKFMEKVKKRNEKKGVKPPPTPIKRPNVVHLLIDSVSKEAFYRRLPNFANYLTSLNDSGRFDVVEFQKFHVIGLNSPANQIPIMTGHHQVDDWATESYIYKILRYFSGDRQICSPFRTQLNTDLPLKLSEGSHFSQSKA